MGDFFDHQNQKNGQSAFVMPAASMKADFLFHGFPAKRKD